MKNKILTLLLMCLLTLGLTTAVSAAGSYIIKNSTTDLVIVDTAGNLNVTSGQIAENGTWLQNLYCKLTGCTVTGTISAANITVTERFVATGATLVLDSDSINESKISFDTVCGTGNHLYISGNNLACEAEPASITLADVVIGVGNWSADRPNYVNYSSIVGAVGNWSVDRNNYVNYSSIVGAVGNWSLDRADYINATVANATYVKKAGDTMTGALNMSETLITLTNTNITGSNVSKSFLTIDATGNVIITLIV